ncbi:MAG: tight adherence protein C [Nitriliruptoraceae bacterium]|jgi:tight adherence protein C
MDPLIIVAVAVFGAIVVGGTAGFSLALERRRVNLALRSVATVELGADQLRDASLALPAANRLLVPVMERALGAARRFTPVHQLARFDGKLELAGHPEGWDPARLAAIRFFGRLIGPILAAAALLSAGVGTAQTAVVAGMVALMVHLGPDVLLNRIISRRRAEVRATLADAIDLLIIMVEAGLGFDVALGRVARQVPGALGEEMHRTVQEIRLGRGRSDALRGLADRTGIIHVRGLVSAIIQADQFGLTISDVLRQQADELRERRRQEAHEHAQKIPVKVLMPLIFFIMPALFVVLLGPGTVQIYEAIIR